MSEFPVPAPELLRRLLRLEERQLTAVELASASGISRFTLSHVRSFLADTEGIIKLAACLALERCEALVPEPGDPETVLSRVAVRTAKDAMAHMQHRVDEATRRGV